MADDQKKDADEAEKADDPLMGPKSDDEAPRDDVAKVDDDVPPPADADEDEDDADLTDAASPEAIAKRVAALGGEDELERIAEEEEQKLRERRARAKKKRGKKGLEAAASKRLARIGAKADTKT